MQSQELTLYKRCDRIGEPVYKVSYGQRGYMSTGVCTAETLEDAQLCVEEIKNTVFGDPKYEFEHTEMGCIVHAPGHELDWDIEIFKEE